MQRPEFSRGLLGFTTAHKDERAPHAQSSRNQLTTTEDTPLTFTESLLTSLGESTSEHSFPTTPEPAIENNQKHVNTFPSDILGKKYDNGAGQLLFNRGNPHDPSFDEYSPGGRIDHAIVIFEGSATVQRIAAISETTIEDVKSYTDVEGMYVYDENTDTISAPHLREFLGEVTERGINYQELILAPSIGEIEQRNKDRDIAQREFEERALTAIHNELRTFQAD